MTKVINCECGYTARGETDEELVADTREHVQEQHPDMAGISDEQILAMADEQQ
jgi:predicted small metal-binding protein